MKRLAFLLLCLVVFTPVCFSSAAASAIWSASTPAGLPSQLGIPRFPAVSATHIAFLFGGELWLVPHEGGTASPLTRESNPKSSPKFSPDGRILAFTGDYDGVYTIPVAGGPVTRITHHPGATDFCDWTPDGRLLFMTDAFLFVGNFDGGTQSRLRQLFTVPAAGGLPTKLPVPYGANGAISPGGQWLAYTPYAEGQREHRKRYQGGLAPDIWLFNLRTHQSRKMTDWKGTDTVPMWHGRTIYYLSDAGPEQHRNIWSYDIKSGRRRQITHFKDFDVKWPSIGPGAKGHGEIVFVNGIRLYLLDLGTDKAHEVNVTFPEDRLDIHPRTVDASRFPGGWSVSPDGRQAVIAARGDLWIVSTEKGSSRNLLHTSGAAERSPSWSPDGRWIAYFSDAGGEYQLYIVPTDGIGPPRQLTHLGIGFRYEPVWSPDSRRIAFSDSTGRLYLHTIESAETRQIHQDSQVRQPQLSWSPDSSWLAYTRSVDQLQSLWLYSVKTGMSYPITAGGYNDRSPAFDRQGDYLFFVSDRNFDPLTYDSVDYSNFIYPTTDLVMAVPLRRDLGAPWQAKRDEPIHWAAGSARSLVIDFEDIERRAVVVASDQGRYSNLAVAHDGQLLYSFVPGGLPTTGNPSIRLLDFAEWRQTGKREPKTVLGGTGDFQLFGDGEKLLVRTYNPNAMAIVAVAPDQKIGQPIRLDGMSVRIEPQAEWRQIFHEAWRLYRDFFYDPTMRGVNWPAMWAKYAKLLNVCANREDLDYLLGEMLGELSSSHVYVNPPPTDQPSSESVGMLGVDFALDHGAYRIVKIHDSAPSDTTARNPLRQPGVNIREGDYLLAVNSKPLDTKQDPWAAFKGLAGKDVTLTVSRKPTLDQEAREVVVQPGSLEIIYRHRAWVEANRAYVERRSGGRVGYVYLHMTSEYGFREFTRLFGPQRRKQALIVDARWNQGGHIPYHLLDVLSRRHGYVYGVDLRRSEGQPGPDYMLEGPRCLLINGVTMSGGDFLAYLFHKRGLGELIGTRTMGSMVGVGGVNIPFLDGGSSSPPNVGFYDSKGKSVVEGYGVEPNIRIPDDPAQMVDGRDPQLAAAVHRMMDTLRMRTPAARPRLPFEGRIGRNSAAR